MTSRTLIDRHPSSIVVRLSTDTKWNQSRFYPCHQSVSMTNNVSGTCFLTILADAILKLRLTSVHTPQQDDLFQNAPHCQYRYYIIHILKVNPGTHHNLLTVPRNRAVLGNVAIFAAVVTSFVASRFGAIGRDVTHLAAVEATPILGTSLVDHLPCISF